MFLINESEDNEALQVNELLNEQPFIFNFNVSLFPHSNIISSKSKCVKVHSFTLLGTLKNLILLVNNGSLSGPISVNICNPSKMFKFVKLGVADSC